MTNVKLKKNAGYFFVIMLLVFIFINANINLHKTKRRNIENFYYLPSGKYLNLISFGFNNVFGDLLWMNTISYVGTHIVTDRKYIYLYHMLDIITRINPYFKYPYHFAGTIIPWEIHKYDETLKILRRGNRYLPNDWVIWFQEGFIYMYFKDNYKEAAYYFQEAAKKPDCPTYVTGLAAKLLTKAYNVNTAINVLYTMYKETKEKHVKANIKAKLNMLIAERNFEILNKAVAEYKEKIGNYPLKIDNLISSGILKKIPTEPYGGKYYIDKFGKVKSTKYNKRVEIYRKHK